MQDIEITETEGSGHIGFDRYECIYLHQSKFTTDRSILRQQIETNAGRKISIQKIDSDLLKKNGGSLLHNEFREQLYRSLPKTDRSFAYEQELYYKYGKDKSACINELYYSDDDKYLNYVICI